MPGDVKDVEGEVKNINPPELLAYSSFDLLRLDGRAERPAAPSLVMRNWPSSHPVFLILLSYFRISFAR